MSSWISGHPPGGHGFPTQAVRASGCTAHQSDQHQERPDPARKPQHSRSLSVYPSGVEIASAVPVSVMLTEPTPSSARNGGWRVPVAVTTTVLPSTRTVPDQPASAKRAAGAGDRVPGIDLVAAGPDRGGRQLVGAGSGRLLCGATGLDLLIDQLATAADQADEGDERRGGDDQGPYRRCSPVVSGPAAGIAALPGSGRGGHWSLR